jgi:hypothetical protein
VVEWLKVKALISNPSTAKNQNKTKDPGRRYENKNKEVGALGTGLW